MIADIDLVYLRILLAIIMLSIATFMDIKKREISDWIWVIFGIVAVGLIFIEPNLIIFLTNIGWSLIVAPFVLLIWRIGLFGGADAFAIIILALLAPQFTLTDSIVTPFSTITNAVLLSIIPLFVNLIRNTVQIAMGKDIFDGFDEKSHKKLIAIFIGYKAKNPKYSFSLEKKSGKSKKLNLTLQHAENSQFCRKPNTWVTPAIPYMVFIFAGFIVQLLYGDIIFGFLR